MPNKLITLDNLTEYKTKSDGVYFQHFTFATTDTIATAYTKTQGKLCLFTIGTKDYIGNVNQGIHPSSYIFNFFEISSLALVSYSSGMLEVSESTALSTCVSLTYSRFVANTNTVWGTSNISNNSITSPKLKLQKITLHDWLQSNGYTSGIHSMVVLVYDLLTNSTIIEIQYYVENEDVRNNAFLSVDPTADEITYADWIDNPNTIDTDAKAATFYSGISNYILLHILQAS